MFNSELETFLVKFHQLLRDGYTAHLYLDANAGQAWVGLRVMLGSSQQQYHHQPQPQKQRSPSYYRRQERRKAAREAAEQPAEKASDVQENVESEKVYDKEEAAEVSNSNVKNAERANIEFSCELCDFQSAILNYKKACLLEPMNQAFFLRVKKARYYEF